MARTSLITGLLSLGLLLSWTIWEAGQQPTIPDPLMLSESQEAFQGVPNKQAPPTLQTYQAIVKRPLFFADRSSQPATAVQSEQLDRPEPDSPAAPNLILSAVIVEGDSRSALMRQNRQSQSIRLNPGELLAGWRLIAIQEDGVTLESDGHQVHLPLHNYKTSTSPVASSHPNHKIRLVGPNAPTGNSPALKD